jgi:hypothetical protein
MTLHSSRPSPAGPPVTLFDSEPRQFYAGHFRNVSIVVWVSGADGPAATRMRAVAQHLIAKYPDGHSNVTIVLNGVAPPTEEARAAFAHIFDGRLSDLRCMAVVLEGEGFWASALRSTVTALRQGSSSSFALKLFSALEPVTEWLPSEHLARTGVALSASELRAALMSMRYEIAQTP